MKNRLTHNPFFVPQADHRKLRFHVFSVPHNPSHTDFVSCAFAQKSIKACWMLKSVGHTVYHYGNKLSVDKKYPERGVICDEHISVTTEAQFMDAYPNSREVAGYVDPHVKTDAQVYLDRINDINTVYEFKKRYQIGDYICYIVPTLQRAIYSDLVAQQLPVHHVEFSVGYKDAYMPYKVFESPAIRAWHYGYFSANLDRYHRLSEEQKKSYPYDPNTHLHFLDIPEFDAVIPYSYTLSQFDFRIKKEDDLLYLGRMIPTKGVAKIIEIAKRAGKKLLIAGTGDFEKEFGKPPKHVELLGPANLDLRRELLSKVSALFVLTDYWEPFGAIQIEAMASGTPPIGPDSGGFGDIIRSGYNGYRVGMNQVEEGVWACRNVDRIDPYNLRDYALRFTNEQNALRYNQYFQNLQRAIDFNGSFHDIENPHRENLDWIDFDRKIEWPVEWMQPVD